MKKKKSKVLNKLDNNFKLKLEGLFGGSGSSNKKNTKVKVKRKKPIKINFSDVKIGAVTPEAIKPVVKKEEIRKIEKEPPMVNKVLKIEKNTNKIKDKDESIIIKEEVTDCSKNFKMDNRIMDKLIELNEIILDIEINKIKNREIWYNKYRDKIVIGSIISLFILKLLV